LLFHKRTSTAQGSRGMVHADFHAENGQLIASVTQEGLLRVKAPQSSEGPQSSAK
jgi:acyl-CoA thioesterase